MGPVDLGEGRTEPAWVADLYCSGLPPRHPTSPTPTPPPPVRRRRYTTGPLFLVLLPRRTQQDWKVRSEARMEPPDPHREISAWLGHHHHVCLWWQTAEQFRLEARLLNPVNSEEPPHRSTSLGQVGPQLRGHLERLCWAMVGTPTGDSPGISGGLNSNSGHWNSSCPA